MLIPTKKKYQMQRALRQLNEIYKSQCKETLTENQRKTVAGDYILEQVKHFNYVHCATCPR